MGYLDIGKHGRYGLGNTPQGDKIASAAVSTGLATAAALDPEPISKGILAVGALISGFFFQPDMNKIATTQIVNQAEPLLHQNVVAWQSLPANQKTVANQTYALANFTDIWNTVVKSCSTGQFGTAGQNCVGDRQRGGKWDWFAMYYDPIANDPNVIPDTISNSSLITVANDASGNILTEVSNSISSGNINWELWLGVGAIGLALLNAVSGSDRD